VIGCRPGVDGCGRGFSGGTAGVCRGCWGVVVEEKLNFVLRRSIPSEMISMLGMSSDSGMLITLLVVESASLFPLNVGLSFTRSFSLVLSLSLSLSQVMATLCLVGFLLSLVVYKLFTITRPSCMRTCGNV